MMTKSDSWFHSDLKPPRKRTTARPKSPMQGDALAEIERNIRALYDAAQGLDGKSQLIRNQLTYNGGYSKTTQEEIRALRHITLQARNLSIAVQMAAGVSPELLAMQHQLAPSYEMEADSVLTQTLPIQLKAEINERLRVDMLTKEQRESLLEALDTIDKRMTLLKLGFKKQLH